MCCATCRIADVAVRTQRARMGVPGTSAYDASGLARSRSRAALSVREAMVAGARRARSTAVCPDGLHRSRISAYVHRLRRMACHFRRSLMLGPRHARYVLGSRWVLSVAQASARLKNQLAAATRRDQRTNAVRDSYLAMIRADPEYLRFQPKRRDRSAEFTIGHVTSHCCWLIHPETENQQ